jgi:hypothetical protein
VSVECCFRELSAKQEIVKKKKQISVQGSIIKVIKKNKQHTVRKDLKIFACGDGRSSV